MSLLMDALSKAEKERHKVEKGSHQQPKEEVLSEPEELFFENKNSVEEKPLEEKRLDLSFLSLTDEEKEKTEQESLTQTSKTELPDGIPLLDVIEEEPDLPPEQPQASKVESKQNYSVPVLGIAKKPSNQTPWFIGGGVVLLVAMVVGYYYFENMETHNSSIIGNTTLDHNVLQEQQNGEIEVEEKKLIEDKTIEILEKPQITLEPKLKAIDPVIKKQNIVKKAAPEVKKEEPPVAIAPPLIEKEETIHVQLEEPKIDYFQQALERGYQAYQTGYMIRAQQQYQIALQYEPDHLDALLGMAVISQSLNNEQQARAYYKKLLTLDPKNSTAISGLISMQQGFVQSGSESRLKLLLSEEPDAAFLHAALGAQYIAGSRWPEAQQAFLKAYHYDSNNPDYTYNLAISLDHLGQTQMAVKYYKQALFLSQQFPAGFNNSVIESRLLSLSNGGIEP